MKLGLCLPQLGPTAEGEKVAGVARRAEEVGDELLWVGDRLLTPDAPRDSTRPAGTAENQRLEIALHMRLAAAQPEAFLHDRTHVDGNRAPVNAGNRDHAARPHRPDGLVEDIGALGRLDFLLHRADESALSVAGIASMPTQSITTSATSPLLISLIRS